MPVAVFVSSRLGGDDGVGAEASNWQWALEQLGFTTRRAAGAFAGPAAPGDLELPSLLADDPVGEGDVAVLREALAAADLVVVENICSLPRHVAAARRVTEVVAGAPARVVFHHHDLPWQRREDDHLADEFPPRVAGALHVTVNLRSRRELQARGYDAVAAIPKHFDFDAPRGDRDATRAAMGFADDDLVVFQPTRAIERKNVPGGVRFAQRLASVVRDRPVRYWLRGPVGDEYAPVFERLLERAPVPVTLETTTALADSYAAADLVVLPSTWENFGRATVESAIAGRPVVVFPYPVLGEIAATGVRSFPIDDPTAVARFLREPADVQARYAEVNAHRARLSYALPLLPETIGRLFAEAGWSW